MRTIGQIIHEERTKKKISYENLASITKIKKEFVKALEKEDWQNLPEYPVVTGFVKNVSKALGISTNTAVATLRRDYPKKNLRINPKPDVAKEFVWGPKQTFLVGIVLVFMGIIAYLVFQYVSFISPPPLVVDVPKEGQVITSGKLTVTGTTDPEATIVVNNQPIIVGDDGKFATDIEVADGTGEVDVVAKSRSGKQTVVSRRIEVKLNGQ